MGDTTQIEWTHIPGYTGGTWNPWQGCTKVSEACKNCYMFRDKARYGQDPTVVVRSKNATFFRPRTVKEPHAWFVNSWSDFFHAAADPWREAAWQLMYENPQHLFLILTKRIERAEDCLPPEWGEGWPNVWLGVTAENQKRADERIPKLLAIPAAVRFVSCEPLLSLINLAGYDMDSGYLPRNAFMGKTRIYSPGLDWVICGGESGPNCRPMFIEWARYLKDQCQDAGVAFFMKQMGGYPDKRDGLADFPEDLRIREFPVVKS